MEGIEREISRAEAQHLAQQSQTLQRQNELLKREVQQLRELQASSQKELAVYKRVVIGNSSDGEVLELQHQRIFELETQLELLQNKYSKMVRSGGSQEQTLYASRCRDYERKMQEREAEHQREVAGLKERLMKQSASEIVETKRMITSPGALVKKPSQAIGKFV